jgi:hypothetical protein
VPSVIIVLTRRALSDYKKGMLKKISITLAVILCIVTGTSPEAFSVQAGTGLPSGSSFLPQEHRVCSLVQQDLDRGVRVRSVVKTSIQMGYNACMVVKCALSAGGDPKEVIGGAIDAGTPSDVVARCSLNAGAGLGEVLADLRSAGTNACYVQPLGYSEPPVTPPGPPTPPPPPPPLISPYKP